MISSRRGFHILSVHLPSQATTRRHSSIRSLSSLAAAYQLPTTNYPNNKNVVRTTKQHLSNNSPFDEMEHQQMRRNKNIIMHPNGTGKDILPGDFVIKVNSRTGQERKVLLEHEKGYFWALKDLDLTKNKPILSNQSIIPAAEAEKFPTLTGLKSLTDEIVDIPDFFTRNNQSKDATAQCTLVAISYKDYGAQLLPSWITPFDSALRHGKDSQKYEVVRISINEGRVAKWLSPFIVSGTKKNVPQEDHERTLLYYGGAGEWRDVLRMHNIYTGYVYLVDGIGRVRWAGSGSGSEEEVENMIEFARELTKPAQKVARQSTSAGPRVGKKLIQQ